MWTTVVTLLAKNYTNAFELSKFKILFWIQNIKTHVLS